MSHSIFRPMILAVMLTALAACSTPGGQASGAGSAERGDTLTRHARLLTLVDHGDWTAVEIASPWDTAAPPARYALIDRRSATPPAVPEGFVTIGVPVERSVVASAIHVAAIDELGAAQAIAGVNDAAYVATPSVKRRLARGEVADVGNSAEPSVELMLSVDPDLVLATPYAGSDHSALAVMKVPVMEMADYMESTPEGRAEWLRLIGRLYGRGAEADTIHAGVMRRYAALKALAATDSVRPTVITERVMSGTWHVPAGGSYMARLLADAGARYPFASTPGAGSLALSFAQVLDRAGEADFWLIKTYGPPPTLAQLAADYPLNARFKAWRRGSVYAANTASTTLYEDFPFHPDRLLADYILIFHPSLAPQLPPARYFHPLEP